MNARSGSYLIPIPPHPVTAIRSAMFALGWQPIPLLTGQKRPINEGWPLIVGVPVFEKILLNTGFNCSGFRVIDIDIDTAAESEAAFRLAVEMFGPSPLIRRREGTSRIAMVYRGSGRKVIIQKSFIDSRGKKSRRFAVEIMGEGQQLHAFGLHPSGTFPEWDDASPANFPAADLPLFDEAKIPAFWDALAAAIEADPREGLHLPPAPVKPRPSPAPVPAAKPSDDARGRAYAASGIDREAAALKTTASGRNGALYVAAQKLGHHVAAGWLTAADVFRALEDASAANGYAKKDGIRQVRATIESGLKSSEGQPTVLKPIEPLPDYAGPILAAHEAARAAKRQIAAPSAPKLFGDGKDWTRPAGILADLAEWIMTTSRRPNRPLAVAAATAILSVLCARHLYGPTGTGLNLYIAIMAETSVGKDRPFHAPAEVLAEIQLPTLHQTAKAFSVSAFEGLLGDSPCCIATVDEMASNLLARISHKRSTLHEASIKPFLLELWSRELGKGAFLTTRRAAQASVAIEAPCLTLFGASTPDAFFASLTADNVGDGFMNRFLLAPAAPRAAKNPNAQRSPLPQYIIDTLQGIVPDVRGTGNIGDAIGFYRDVTKPPQEGRRVLYASDEIEAAANQLEEDILTIADLKNPGYELWGRTFEYSIRLATIHAVSRQGLGASVDFIDLEFGASWAISSARTMIEASRDHMASSEYEANFNKIKRVIREAGTISKRDILRKCQSINARDRDAILAHLKGAGLAGPEETSGEWVWLG